MPSRVLFITNPTTRGHINPLVAVVERLVARGVEVGWLVLSETQGQALSTLPVTPVPVGRDFPLPEGGVGGYGFSTDEERLRAFKAICIDSVEPMLPAVERTISRFSPDVLGVDCVNWLGVAAALRSSRPWLGLCMGLKLLAAEGFDFPYRTLVRRLDADRDALFSRLGIAPEVRLMECMSPHGNVTFATAALVGDDPGIDARNELVGPSLPTGARGDEPADFDWTWRDPSRPLVYASFGTLFWRRAHDHFGPIARACATVGAQLLLGAGAFADSAHALELPGDVHVVAYAPQLEVLGRAAAFVTHGGANSTMEACASGCPQIVVPMDVDQPLQMFFAERAGVGIGIWPEALTAERMSAALSRILAGELDDAVARVASAYAAADGATTVAERLLWLAGR